MIIPRSSHDSRPSWLPWQRTRARSARTLRRCGRQKRVYTAFGDSGSPDGLTRAELAVACADVVPQRIFESWFELFVGMGLLQRSRDKRYEHRYVFNPTSGAALLVFDRLSEIGGVQEIVMLLDRIRDALRNGFASQAVVERMLTKARRELSINADHLRHLVRSRAFEQL